MLRYTFLLTLLPFSLASFLTGYSTTAHFPCSGTSCPLNPTTLPESTISALLTSLTSGSPTTSDLPLSPSFKAPEISLIINAPISDPSSILHALTIAASADSPTSFTSRAILPNLHTTHTFHELTSLMESGALLTKHMRQVLQVTVTETQVPELLSLIRDMSSKVEDRGLVVLWASRQGIDAASGDDTVAAEANDPMVEGVDAPVGEFADANATAGDAAANNQLTPVGKVMRPPEITADQLVGLIVGFVFLLIFLPGFMCLYNIQAPQTFEAFDGNDAKKKMQ